MKIRRMYVCTSAVLAAAVLAGVSAVPAFATGGGGPVARTVLGSGSDTTELMMNSIDRLYQFSPGCDQLAPTGTTQWLDFSCLSPDPTGTITTENYAHDQVAEAYFLGSSGGISQLCDQGQAGVAHIDFARSSRAPTNPDTCTGMHFVAYARDGISWEGFNLPPVPAFPNGSGIHNMNNQAGTCAGSTGATQFCLSQSQLQGIFITCSIKNWNQVGGQNVPIQIYTPQANSGTRKTWDKFLGGDSSHCIPANQQATHIVPENSNTAIKATHGAIFPFSYGVWSTQVAGKGGAVLGAVDNVPVTAGTIQDGSFPFGRFLYNVYCSASCSSGASSTATVNYVGEEGWICKPSASHAADPVTGKNYTTEIQKAITTNGFVPLPSGVIGGGDPNSDFCRLFTT